jgi:hypothetical protein
VRVWIVLAALVGAGALAAAAHATARPQTAQDSALLARPATYEESIAEQVARRLTGRDASVRCGSLHVSDPHVLGITPTLNGHALDYFLMRPAECTDLSWFRQSPARWDPRSCAPADCAHVGDITWALSVVAHESYHLLGYSNEAQVECYGMQSIWFVANKLGASVAEAQAFGKLFATQMYPARRTATPRYWSAECRDGGRYDLRRSLTSWPS